VIRTGRPSVTAKHSKTFNPNSKNAVKKGATESFVDSIFICKLSFPGHPFSDTNTTVVIRHQGNTTFDSLLY
jgi:hypothetical protein